VGDQNTDKSISSSYKSANGHTNDKKSVKKFPQLTFAKSYANRKMFLKVAGSDSKQRRPSSLDFNFSVESHLTEHTTHGQYTMANTTIS